MPTEDDRFQNRFREALQEIGARIKPPVSVPRQAVRRARVKLGRNVIAGSLTVVLLAVGGIKAIQLHPTTNRPITPGSSLAPVRVPTATKPLRMLVVGDSFSQDIETALAPVADSRYLRIIGKGLAATGLSRPDYYNWPQALSMLMRQYNPDVVLVMLGGNDPQPIPTPSGDKIPFDVGDSRWSATYRSRV